MLVVEARLGLRILCGFLLASTIVLPQDPELAAESHKAKELMASHHFAEAVPIYEKLVKAVPGNPGLLLNLGLAEEMSGQPARAIPHFEAVVAALPENEPALLELAMAQMQTNHSREAISPLRTVLKLDPTNRNARGMLADSLLEQRQFSEAAEEYRSLLDSVASDPRAWYGLGKCYEALAAKTFERLTQTAPESPYMAELLADTRLERRQYRSAFFFYKEAEKKNAELPGIHFGLAQVYRDTGHADWAAKESEEETHLNAPDCGHNNAECSFLSKHYLEAAKSAGPNADATTLFWVVKAYNAMATDAFERLSRLPESVQSHALQAQILHDHKQDHEAAEEWHAALKLAPDDTNLKLQWTVALFDSKDYQAAMLVASELLAQSPRSAELNYLLGASLYRTEQTEKAIPYLQRAVAIRDDNPAADAALGLALVSVNKNTEAIPYLKKALTLDDDGSVHYSLARAYRAAGDSQQAMQAMREYQNIQKRNQEINGELAKEAEIVGPGE